MRTIKSFAFSCLILFSASAYAQDNGTWSLEQCINHAQKNNLMLKQRSLNADYEQNQYEQRRRDLLPDANASTGYSTSMGRRVKDDVNYAINDNTTHSGNLGIQSSTPVFHGFTRRTAIERQHTNWQAALMEVEKASNDLSLNITSLYMQILFDKELLAAARNQLEVVQQQVDRTDKLVQAGSLPDGALLEVRSIATREMLNVTNLENNLFLSLLDLAQAMDLESTEGFDVLTPEIPEITAEGIVVASDVYQTAVIRMPQIIGSQFQLESRELDVKMAKGNLWPQVTFNMGWGTNVVKSNSAGFDFGDQFKNNAITRLGVNIGIPIFNGLSARTNITNASLSVKNAQYELERQKQILNKEIQQAQADAEAAFRQYEAGKAAVDSYTESFRYTEQRFNVGMVNSVDYNVAKTEYMKAESDLIQAKYTYLLRLKILDFYQGKPIVL